MTRKRRSGRKTELEHLEMALVLNGKANAEGPKKKKWSIHDLTTIEPLTPNQEEMFHAWYNYSNLCVHGSAGTGKTFISVYLALREILHQRQQQLIIVRSAVQSRDIGFLPGTEDDKLMNYELPYYDIFHELLGKYNSYKNMKDAGLVKFYSTSFLRGLTWDNAIVIFDESENGTFHEIDNVMTRLGKNTRIILAGDSKQTDLDGSMKLGSEGISQAMNVFKEMNNFACITFNFHDIVRGDTVKSWIKACNNLYN